MTLTPFIKNHLSLTFLLLLFFATNSNGQSSGQALIDQAEQLANAKEYAKSNDKYQQALPIFLREQDWPRYYQTRYAMVYNYGDNYQFDEAEKEVISAIEHFETNYRDTFIIWQPKLYHAAGQVYKDLHKYETAIANNRLAMKYYQNVKNENERKKYTSYMYNNIGSVYKNARSMDSALHYFQLALPLKIEAIGKNANSTLRTIKAISGIYQDWGQLDKAIETQTIALNGALEEGNKDAEAQAYNGLSQMYQRKKDFETSKKYISKALETYRKMPEFELDLAHSYHQMGNVLETEKAHQESLQWYTTAKGMYRKLHNGKASYQEGNSTMNLGKAHNYMAQQLANSSPYIDATHPEVRALRAKGIEYFEENEEIFAEAVGRDHARWIELWLSKGVCHFENLDTIAAHELFQKAYDRAYKLAPEKSYDRSLACLSLAKTTVDLDSAIALYQKGLWELSNGWEYDSVDDNPTAQEVFYEDWSVRIMINKSMRLQDQFNAGKDDDFLRSGIKTINAADALLDESRLSFLTTSAKIFLGRKGHEVYSQGVDLCHDLGGQEAQAFQYIEKDKGLVLLEALQSGKKIQDVMVPDSLSGRLRRISAKIAELTTKQNQFKESDKYSVIGAQIFDLDEERKAITAKIKTDYPITARITEDGQTISLEEVQKQLANNEVIYEYLKSEDDLFILKITKTSSKLYKTEIKGYQADLDSLLRIINDENIALNSSNSKSVWDSYQKHAYNLYKQLLPDYQNEDLLIIPDGNLNYLPFELLITEPSSGDIINYSLLPYLLKSGVIKYAFSNSLHFADVHIKEDSKHSLLAIAPSYPSAPSGFLASRAGFTSLAHTATEALNISKLMGGDNVIGEGATVETFKNIAPDYEVLHLAMHAYTHDKDPMLSGMVFSETGAESDNILHAHELYNMNLPSELVVLSACNTGLGQYKQGEGVMSLGRAFRHAGTKNIIMSLWQANDASTSEIMTSFYKNIENGEPKAMALRDAKLEYLESNANVFPHYWGAFVLLGDDQPLEFKKQSPAIWILLSGFLLLLLLFWKRRKGQANP